MPNWGSSIGEVSASWEVGGSEGCIGLVSSSSRLGLVVLAGLVAKLLGEHGFCTQAFVVTAILEGMFLLSQYLAG